MCLAMESTAQRAGIFFLLIRKLASFPVDGCKKDNRALCAVGSIAGLHNSYIDVKLNVNVCVFLYSIEYMA
jgi:hypothetical protein